MIENQKVAFATDDGTSINQHFGRLRGFVVITVADGQETERVVVPRPQQADQPGERRSNHVALLDPIADCATLVAGGMGLPMAGHINQRGISLILTTRSSIDEGLELYLAGSLEHEPDRAHRPNH